MKEHFPNQILRQKQLHNALKEKLSPELEVAGNCDSIITPLTDTLLALEAGKARSNNLYQSIEDYFATMPGLEKAGIKSLTEKVFYTALLIDIAQPEAQDLFYALIEAQQDRPVAKRGDTAFRLVNAVLRNFPEQDMTEYYDMLAITAQITGANPTVLLPILKQHMPRIYPGTELFMPSIFSHLNKPQEIH